MVTLAGDSSIDTIIGALPIAVGGGAIFYGIGRFVQVMVARMTVKAAPEEQPATAVAA